MVASALIYSLQGRRQKFFARGKGHHFRLSGGRVGICGRVSLCALYSVEEKKLGGGGRGAQAWSAALWLRFWQPETSFLSIGFSLSQRKFCQLIYVICVHIGFVSALFLPLNRGITSDEGCLLCSWALASESALLTIRLLHLLQDHLLP